MRKLILALSLSLASSLAFADTAFQKHDNNGDGKLSRDEFYGVARDRGIFADYDINKDRRLDKNEFGEANLGTDFVGWDTDRDTYLTDTEFYAGTYDYYDKNDDDFWDVDEWDGVDWFD